MIKNLKDIFKSKLLETTILSLFFMTAPFAVSTMLSDMLPFNPFPTAILTSFIVVTYFFYHFIMNRKICLTKFEKKILALFFIPIVLSFITILTTIIGDVSIDYLVYLREDLIGRTVLILTNFIVIVGLLSLSKSWTKEKAINIIKKYYYGIMIFVSVGMWQFFYIIFEVPFLNLNTRNHLHGIDRSAVLISSRITSFADEPSFLAPLLIDLIILAFFVSKKPLFGAFLSLFLLIFSYSGGGYFNFIVVLIVAGVGYYFYKNNFNKELLNLKKKKTVLIGILTMFTFIIITFQRHIGVLLYPVIGRLGTMFDPYSSLRAYMLVNPFSWVFRGTILNALFGFGPSSFNYLHRTEIFPPPMEWAGPLHVTSNNLFADTVFELGFVGLFAYIFLFASLILKPAKNLKRNKYNLLGFILSIHLLMTSLYRGDFMQPRFWIILFVILKLIEFGEKEKQLQNFKISENSQPPISVIIPVYNKEKDLHYSLDSLTKQNYKNFEVIIIDDGSVDGSRKIIQQYLNKDSRFKYFYQVNSGVSEARNNGIELAIGQYITFLDADDFYDECFIDKMVTKIVATDADVCYCGYNIVANNETTPVRTVFDNESTLLNYIMGKLLVSTNSWMIKKELIQENKIVFPKGISWGEDFEFFCEVLAYGDRIVCIKEYLTNYQNEANSLQLSSFSLDKLDREYESIQRIQKNEIINCNPRIEKMLLSYRLPARLVYRLTDAISFGIEHDEILKYSEKYAKVIFPFNFLWNNKLRSLKLNLYKLKLRKYIKG